MATTQQLWLDYKARVAHMPIGLDNKRPLRRERALFSVRLPGRRVVQATFEWTCTLAQAQAQLVLQHAEVFGGCAAAFDGGWTLQVEGRVASAWRGILTMCTYVRNPDACFVQRDKWVTVQTSDNVNIEVEVVQTETVESVALRAQPEMLGEDFKVGTRRKDVSLLQTLEEQDLIGSFLIITVRGRRDEATPH